MSDVLDAYLQGVLAGRFTQDFAGHVSFSYEDAYRADPQTTPLSFSMPKRRREYPGEEAGCWIDNLLPDSEELRARIAIKFSEERPSPFNLLRHVGVDAAGAVQIVPAGMDPETVGSRVEWSLEDIGNEIRRLHRDNSAVATSLESGRWSLAGQQGKFALSFIDGKWYEPVGRFPSTHIFKVGVQGLRDSDVAEFITMRAAGKLGVRTASVTLEEFDGEIAVVVQRYDRSNFRGAITRIHQEDSCQALSYPMVRKYQSDGGPSMGDIAGVVRREMRNAGTQPLEELARWHAFNAISGATDGHSKNVSFVMRGNASRLAPAYDLIAGPLISNAQTAWYKYKMAMKFGGEYRFRNIGIKEISLQAAEFGLEPEWYVAEVGSMLDGLEQAYMEAIGEAEAVVGTSQSISRMRRNISSWATNAKAIVE
ncbi:MAG: HipA domain-containing protein [Ancrocorticia sp.]|uniref:HipA domain-containing protein n=1 Tax=Ancrocorticia sp. TaxID=2593684 RepID=UPI003F9151EB